MSDVKESKEVLAAGVVVVLALVKELKDGLQVGKDAVALVDDLMQPEARAKLVAAVDGLSKVMVELKGLDSAGVVELIVELVKDVSAVLSAAKPAVEVAPQA